MNNENENDLFVENDARVEVFAGGIEDKVVDAGDAKRVVAEEVARELELIRFQQSLKD